jgi:hypothetical protein
MMIPDGMYIFGPDVPVTHVWKCSCIFDMFLFFEKCIYLQMFKVWVSVQTWQSQAAFRLQLSTNLDTFTDCSQCWSSKNMCLCTRLFDRCLDDYPKCVSHVQTWQSQASFVNKLGHVHWLLHTVVFQRICASAHVCLTDVWATVQSVFHTFGYVLTDTLADVGNMI